MKVLFLDFDGVLNDQAFYEHVKDFPSKYSGHATDRVKRTASIHINPYNVQNLKYILKTDPEVRIVVSSTWRKLFTIDQLKWILKKHGVPADKIIGTTEVPGPGKMEGRSSWGNPDMIQRGDLCLKWANENNVTEFVCVDDDDDFDSVRDRFVRTNYKNGLTRSKAESVLKLFGSFEEEPNLFGRDVYSKDASDDD